MKICNLKLIEKTRIYYQDSTKNCNETEGLVGISLHQIQIPPTRCELLMAFLPFLKAVHGLCFVGPFSLMIIFVVLQQSSSVPRNQTKMSEVYNPPSRIQSKSHCGSMEEYQRRWKESIDDPYQFWGQIAKEFHWKKEPTKEDFVNYNFNVNDGPIKVHASSYKYRISANSFRGNYSFLNLTLCTVTFGDST